MKIIENNSTNIITVLHDGITLSSTVSVRFRQLGGSGYVDVPVLEMESDCYTYTITIIVPIDYLHNGSYMMEFIDSSENVLYSTNCAVDGFDEENPRAFLVTDSETGTAHYDTVKPIISITFSDDGLTFSNN